MTGALDLSNNQLNGSIPVQIGDLIYLEHLDLSGNLLTGAIPPEIGNLGVEELFLKDNRFTGRVPQEICNLAMCSSCVYESFDIRRNKLCPPYPSCFFDHHKDEQDSSGCL